MRFYPVPDTGVRGKNKRAKLSALMKPAIKWRMEDQNSRYVNRKT